VDSYDDKALTSINEKLTDEVGKLKDLRNWLVYYMQWLYNDKQNDLKLQREVMMLHHYLKGNNCDYRIHNSLQDSLGNIKKKINYISFVDNQYEGQDNWRDFLMWQMENVDKEPYDIKKETAEYERETYRSPFPPYGKRFCQGHPSPNANKELAERIYEDLK
jgi:chromosome segregation ATPase